MIKSGGYDYTYSYQDREYGRKAAGGIVSFTCIISESGPVPSQGIQAKLVLPSTITESPLKPVQSITLREILPSIISEAPGIPAQGIVLKLVGSVIISESGPTPVQTITAASTATGVSCEIAESAPVPTQSLSVDYANPVTKQPGLGAWVFYPPKFPARGKIRQSTLAPRQSISVNRSSSLHIVQKTLTPTQGMEAEQVRNIKIMNISLAPRQSIVVGSGIGPRARDEEDALMLLMLTA